MSGTESTTGQDASTVTFFGEAVTSSTLLGYIQYRPTLDDVLTFYNYYIGVIPWVATCCNGVSFLVFVYKLMHSKGEKNVNILLAGLAIADILSLSTAMDFSYYFWNDYNFSLLQSTAAGCRIINYINDTGRDCSSYFVLILTLDRFVAVKFPLQRKLWVTSTRVILAMVAVTVCAALAETYQPYLMHYDHWLGRCSASDPNQYNLLNAIIRHTLGFVLPGILVAIFNALIIQALGKFSKKRAAMTGAAEKNNRSLTILLVVISTYSFLVGLPKAVYMYYSEFAVDFMKEQPDSYWIWGFLSDALNMLNHTCNLFFYCMSGSQFRKDLKIILVRVFTCGRRESFVLCAVEFVLHSTTLDRYS